MSRHHTRSVKLLDSEQQLLQAQSHKARYSPESEVNVRRLFAAHDVYNTIPLHGRQQSRQVVCSILQHCTVYGQLPCIVHGAACTFSQGLFEFADLRLFVRGHFSSYFDRCLKLPCSGMVFTHCARCVHQTNERLLLYQMIFVSHNGY